MVRGDSNHYYPGTLGNQPVAVQFHAGSHYVAIRLLSGYIPEEKLKLVHYGSPQHRFEALMNGEVAAATLMEPWITLAEKVGCRAVCRGALPRGRERQRQHGRGHLRRHQPGRRPRRGPD